MIQELLNTHCFKLKVLLEVSNMPKSTYYFELKKIDLDERKNKEIMDKIQEIFEKHKSRYGVRRIYRELLNQGYSISHNKVQRLMNKMHLKGINPREKYHSYKGEVGKTAPNIIERNFEATEPNQKWTTDVSQFNFSWGKCYLSPILDMYNDEIISYDLSLHPNFEQIENMLKQAFDKNENLEGLIFHSDQGWQYQNARYVSALKEKGIQQSMSRKGNCYDNCIMESFFGTLKNEMYYGKEDCYESFEAFKKAIDEYIDYFNNERIQSKTKWMSPVKYRETSICK